MHQDQMRQVPGLRNILFASLNFDPISRKDIVFYRSFTASMSAYRNVNLLDWIAKSHFGIVLIVIDCQKLEITKVPTNLQFQLNLLEN